MKADNNNIWDSTNNICYDKGSGIFDPNKITIKKLLTPPIQLLYKL